MLKWLHCQACFSFLHTSSILSGSSDRLESRTTKLILILRTRHHIQPNTKRPFWSMWRMNTAPNIDMCQSINSNAYRAAISSPLQRPQDPVNHPLIHMICPAMMTITKRLTMWLRRHPDEAIAQHAYWPLPGSICIRRLKRRRTGGKLIQISMITTPTQRRLAVHFGYQT